VVQKGDIGGFSGSIFTDTGGAIVFNLYTNPQEDVSIGISPHSARGSAGRNRRLVPEGADQISAAVQVRIRVQQPAGL
jgi:hypothetical protein